MSTADEMVHWIEGHLDGATLEGLSAHFGYHPNYISSMLHSKTGKKFSEILLSLRLR